MQVEVSWNWFLPSSSSGRGLSRVPISQSTHLVDALPSLAVTACPPQHGWLGIHVNAETQGVPPNTGRHSRCELGRSLALAIVLILALAVDTSGQCTGLCGDVNSNGFVTTADLAALFPYVSTADAAGVDLQCSDVDDWLGVNLRDWVYLLREVFSFWPLDCDISHGKFVPAVNVFNRLHYNAVFPANDTSVTLFVDATFQNLTQAAAIAVSVDVGGESPNFVNVITDTMSASGWEVVSFAAGGTGGIPPGHLMGCFASYDLENAAPGRHTLGRATLIMSPVSHARQITLQLVEIPPGSNSTMTQDGPLGDSDVWELNPSPWIVDLTGDVNNDRIVSAADIIVLINYVFKSAQPPYPHGASGDVNCSGEDTSADIIGLVNYIFKGGVVPCDVAADCTLALDGWTCP